MTRHLPLANQIILTSIVLFNMYGCYNSLHAQTSGTRFHICESRGDECSRPDARLDITWTFNGLEGLVSSPVNRTGVRLTIEKLDSNQIVIRSVDHNGPNDGLTALYTGAIQAGHINGTVEWTWPGHPEYPAKGAFSGAMDEQAAAAPAAASDPPRSAAADAAMPAELLVCENGGVCNAAWVFTGNTGTGTWFARNPIRATLTVLRHEPGYISVRRTDTGDGVIATYAGSLRGDHYSGTIIWGGAAASQQAGTWSATIPQTACSQASNLEPADAMLIGQRALMFKRDREALDCYVVAANAGDATAQTAVGLLYYQGRGGAAQDYNKAFYWLHKAADQGIYAAERSVAEMYLAGLGTQKDPTLAGIYTARADEQKHDMERRQDFEERAQARREEHAERAADRATQLLSSFVLGASFGIFF